MLVQTSVTTASAPATASIGSSLTVTPPASATTPGSGSNPSGVATRTSMPSMPAAVISEWQTLLQPPPTHASVRPASSPTRPPPARAAAVETPQPLAQRLGVGQRLAGVVEIREAVDDGDAGGRGQRLDL